MNVTLCPGCMIPTIRLASIRRTECVKLSEFLQVTVVPAVTVMALGEKRYDGGRSTWLVATGAAGPVVAHPARVSARMAIPALTREDGGRVTGLGRGR